jgi:DNA polymerase elongation subunit (family B)
MSATVEEIQEYLEGYDDQKYIVGIESSYYENKVSLIIHDPEKGKRIEKHRFRPFLWMKSPDVSKLYNGDRRVIKQKMRQFKVKFKQLNTLPEDGVRIDRLENGFKFLVECRGSYGDLLKFFKEGNIDVFDEEHRPNFLTINPTEQFLIQTGKRLFKGMDDYEDVHRLSFDLETTGIDPYTSRIFQIGCKDNKGFTHILSIEGEDEEELESRERQAIITFFKIIYHLKPAIVAGYNSENFDWDFIVKRCEVLNLDIKVIAKTLGKVPFYRRRQTLKMGPEMEYYDQTHMWGFNIMDVSHAVRRAQAINSSIKQWSLKYITKYAKAAKENRVYIPGDRIGKTWADKENDYWFNESNGQWGFIDDLRKNQDGLSDKTVEQLLEMGGLIKTTGKYIVERYLLDDLWETEKVDNIFNQATFLLSKFLPTSYMRSATMGTAATWKLLMLGWSYHKGIGIPTTEPLRPFTGGLSRLLEVGYSKDVVKFDFDGLYPSEQLTHGIFTKTDISGAMRGLLQYNYDNRNLYKELKKEYAAKGDMIKSAYYDTKQLPLKILNNGMFGSISAPNVFPWGDTNMGEKITCTGRQYLRHMIRFFDAKGFRPLVGDTDGFNFSIPDHVDDFVYVSNGRHHSTEEGKEYRGLDAVVNEYNDKYMYGVMGLSIDEICEATINLARKNYADLIDGEVKLVGNTIKSKKLPVYISEFLDKGIRMLLDGDGYAFVNEYYDTVERIYNQEIPLSKIANKSRVRMTVNEYKKRAKMKNKAGNPLPKQAYMELIIKHDLNVDLGDTIYYVNVGTSKSNGDIQTKAKWNKTKIKKYTEEHGNFPFDPNEKEIIINCEYISNEEIERNPDMVGEYNIARYLDAFNKRIKPLLVCFHPDVRDNILIDTPEDRNYFTEKELTLTSGMPFNESDQDTLENLLTITDQEKYFWDSMGLSPYYMFEEFDIVDEYCGLNNEHA